MHNEIKTSSDWAAVRDRLINNMSGSNYNSSGRKFIDNINNSIIILANYEIDCKRWHRKLENSNRHQKLVNDINESIKLVENLCLMSMLSK